MITSSVRAKAWLAAIGLAGSLSLLAGCGGSGSGSATPINQVTTRFVQTNLVSDIGGLAANTDPDLTNPWGIAFNPTGFIWIADNKSGKSTLYNGAGAKQGLIVNLPTPLAATGGAATGQVYNGTSDFLMPNGSPALFLFSTEDGTIVGWNAASGTQALVLGDRSSIPIFGSGAVYKGLAIGSNSAGNFLYAANFRTGQVDVFDKDFRLALLPGSFSDTSLPSNFAPFGIQNIGGDIFVAYARQDAAKEDDVSGAGSGVIDQFDSNGNLKRRFAIGTAAGGTVAQLNSPWGMAVAPANFGNFSNTLLVGNFGDGRINAFNLSTGAFLGQLPNSTGSAPISVPGLWGLAFGVSGSAGSPSALYFTAGIGDAPAYTNNVENHGLFGSITVAP